MARRGGTRSLENEPARLTFFILITATLTPPLPPLPTITSTTTTTATATATSTSEWHKALRQRPVHV